MFFTITGSNGMIGLDKSYRLKKDGQWKQIRNFKEYNEDDRGFKTYEEAYRWLKENTIVNIDDKKVNTEKPSSYTIGDRNIFDFQIIVHRISKPRELFTKQDIKNILLNGDDNYNNSLIIDWDGTPKLIVKRGGRFKNCAVIYETFCAGNNYVGKCSNLNHLDRTYLALLEAWDIHLECGKSIYRDYVQGESNEEELRLKINEKISALK